MANYLPREIEPRRQAEWWASGIYRCPDAPGESGANRPKLYVLDMFPYPSGAGLHVGHPEGYTATDILCRYKRACGFQVLHPMGWDAFGLPAEQYAIETGTHPRVTTQNNVNNFRRQIQSLGFSYDWEREVDTTDPAYVKWTQWIFLLIFDTWYDAAARRGRPIAELPIPDAIAAQGELAVAQYRDDHRLAYQAEVPVNWCPALGTVLANEEVIDGKSERGGHPVERRPLKQWLMRITKYAERLIDDLEPLGWSESIKQMQRNWIGKSEGAEVDFKVVNSNHKVRVYTTRPDTLFGATYMVLAPEHPFVDDITTPEQRDAVAAYREQSARKSDFERTENAKLKTGVATGAVAVNPVTHKPIPIWIADYVLASYGTGAIMAVPAHDERDFAFARAFDLPITVVVEPSAAWLEQTKSTLAHLTSAYTEDGKAIHSDFLNGLDTDAATLKMIHHLEAERVGERRVNYKLRDWLFSRQRYWGEPFPILHEVDASGKRTGIIRPLDADELPLKLPELEDFKPTGSPEGPLVKATDWVEVERDGKRYRRETNTMPQWAGSCWYYLRYIDPHNDQAFVDPKKAKFWLPVDLYVGGAEHAVLHLLYSRFWHKILFDRGLVPTPEPFQRLVNQGMILGETEFTGFQKATAREEVVDGKKQVKLDPTGEWVTAKEADFDGGAATMTDKARTPLACVKVSEEDVEKQGEAFVLKGDPKIRVDARAFKMSKSRGNVVNPDDIVGEYGADSLRLYEMFIGPLEATKPWNSRSVEGVYRFLNRVWRLAIDDHATETKPNANVQDVPADEETLKKLHRLIQKVSDDTERLSFNTAIAFMMEFTNFLTAKPGPRPKSVLATFMQLLAPYAPHIAEEIWVALGETESIHTAPWPKVDAKYLKDDAIEVPIQLNGKVKLKLMVPAELDKASLEQFALADSQVQALLEGKSVTKVIAVPRKMVNFVAN